MSSLKHALGGDVRTAPAYITAGAARPPWALRMLVTAAALGAWFWTQTLLGERPAPPESESVTAGTLLAEHDRLLMLCAPIHRLLLDYPAWADALLIVSSLLVDGLALFLLVRGTFGPSIRPLLGLILLFALRQVCQAMCALPPPGGAAQVIWRYPGFPSLLVTYGVSNDLFFSGHTAIAVFGAIELGRLGRRWLPVAVVIALFEIATVLVLWAHYSMDVYAGAVTAVCMALVADRLAPAVDRTLARLGRAERGWSP
jgi:hypothetical protein